MTENNSDLICPICGAPTRVYMGNARKDKLCAKHANDFKTGKIVKCEDCGKWHAFNETCECKKQKYYSLPYDGFDTCILCNKVTYGYAFCRDCYHKYETVDLLEILNFPVKKQKILEKYEEKNDKTDIKDKNNHKNKICITCGEHATNGIQCSKCFNETVNYIDTINKNESQSDLLDYYYNLKFNIYRMVNIKTIQSYCNKLIAIAILLKNLHNNNSLIDRINKDIKELLEKKIPKEKSIIITEKTENNDAIKANLKQTVDGHMVKSDPETVIDDILYENRIVHAYEKVLTFNNEQKRKKCDWFIPVLNSRQGIYIEYWGMNTEQYIKNKKEKIELYKKYNKPLIEIQKDDYKDKNSLIDYLISEINKIALEFFKIEDFVET